MKIKALTSLMLAFTFTPIKNNAQMNNQTAVQTINAKTFLKFWDEFTGNFIEKKDWKKLWENDKEWTEAIVGTASSKNQDSELGNFLQEKFDLLYRKEEWKVDLVLAKAEIFSTLKDLNNDNMPLDKWFYPENYEILIEHENNIESCWEEMAKLAYLRAKLKVLITYYNYDDASECIKEIEILKHNFKTIIKQTNSTNPENSETEYILIVGQKITENNAPNLVWYKYAFNTKGDSI